jgi:hypothetical protein
MIRDRTRTFDIVERKMDMLGYPRYNLVIAFLVVKA